MNVSRKKKDGFNKMKIIAAVVAFFIGLGCCGALESTYTRNAVVGYVSNGIVSCYDESDNTWEFYGDGFYVGQEVKLIMDNNHTENNIYDDFVKDVLTK